MPYGRTTPGRQSPGVGAALGPVVWNVAGADIAWLRLSTSTTFGQIIIGMLPTGDTTGDNWIAVSLTPAAAILFFHFIWGESCGNANVTNGACQIVSFPYPVATIRYSIAAVAGASYVASQELAYRS